MTQVTQTACADSGNTRSQQIEKKKIIRSRIWVFTVNNYTQEIIDTLTQHFNESCKRYIFQEEIGEECKTPHLQGFCEFKNARSFKSIQKIIKGWHVEKCRSIKKAIAYCGKLKTRNGRVFSKELGYEKHEPFLKQLRLWQYTIIHLLRQKPDDRTIYWIYNREGCAGKTVLCKHLLLDKRYDFVYVNGAIKDAVNALANRKKINQAPTGVLINLSRGQYIDYKALEAIKDGLMFNSKYESGQIVWKTNCHVMVFSNELPNEERLTKDRLKIFKL